MDILTDFFEDFLLILLFILLIPIVLWARRPRAPMRKSKDHQKKENELQQSLEELGYPHSEHYAYIASTTPRWVRLRLSKHRGNRNALVWRIKLLQLLNIVGPKTAELLLVEYMITAETPVRTTATNEWVCAKCGTFNTDTDLFCKDCGEYK